MLKLAILGCSLLQISALEYDFTMNHDTNGYETTSGTVWSSTVRKAGSSMGALVEMQQDITLPQPYTINFDQVPNGYISDGGFDMYDGGNYLYTNYGGGTFIRPYTTSFNRVSSTLFGPGGWYQMNMERTSMMVITQNLGSGMMQFWTQGNLGADGGGTRQLVTYTSGSVKGFRRTVCNAGDPAVHHMYVSVGPSLNQNDIASTDSDYHRLYNIPPNAYMIYFLYASTSGYCGTSAQHTTVFDALVEIYNVVSGVSTTSEPAIMTPSWVGMDLNISRAQLLQLENQTMGGAAFTVGMTFKPDFMTLSNKIFTMTTGTAGLSLEVNTFSAVAAAAVQAQATTMLGNRYAIIFDQIPNGYIADGGNDMYNAGNYLRTNFCGNMVPYTDNFDKVMSTCYGGVADGYYRMNMDSHSQILYGYNANPTSLLSFYISGALGAGGSGVVQQWSDFNRGNLRGFVKSVCNAGTRPTINHMFIVEDSPNAYQYVYTSTYYDYHYLYNVAPQKRFMYFLYATTGGSCVSFTTHQNIFNLLAQNFEVGFESEDSTTAAFKVWTSPTVSSSLMAPGLSIRPSMQYESLAVTANTNGQMSIYYNGAAVAMCITNCTSSTGAATQRGLIPTRGTYTTTVGDETGLLLEHMLINDRVAYSSANISTQMCHFRGNWSNTTGVCVCNPGSTGQYCETCTNGFAGPRCQHTNHGTCYGHGTAQADGTCQCGTGYIGARCQYSDALTCNGNGAAQPDGSCVCRNPTSTSGLTGACGEHCECDCSCRTCTAPGSLYCTSCPVATVPANQFVVVSPVPFSAIAASTGVCTAPCGATQFRNRTTGGCQDVTVCGPAEYEVTAPDAWNDRVCNLSWTPPPNPCGGCPVGEYQTNTPCVPPAESLCMPCTECADGEVALAPCLLTQNRMCVPSIMMPNITAVPSTNAGIHNTAGNIIFTPGVSPTTTKGVFINGTDLEIVQYLTMLKAHTAELERAVAENAAHHD
eukprot:m.69579 g.69579  ORF g.69579 m.69579 type:complete len:981 (-) comp16032_c0_seq1:403-3345(-)